MSDRQPFVYRKRDASTVDKRAKQQGGAFKTPWDGKLTQFKPKGGDYRLRILPPTWKGADHYGIDVWVHNSIGSDNSAYACPKKNKDQPCPICEELEDATRRGEDETYVKSLRATRRVLVWIIDRDREKDGPQIWAMPWTLDRDISAGSQDKRSGETLAIDDPEEGYDVEFTREGKGLQTEYIGVRVARRSSPLSDSSKRSDKWLEFIAENPLSKAYTVEEYDDLAKALSGQAAKTKKDKKKKGGDDDDDDRDDRRRVRTRSERDDDDERPRKRGRDDDDDDDDDDKDDRRSSSRRGRDDDDDDDDERPKKRSRDDDDDDDDDDRKPSKRVKVRD